MKVITSEPNLRLIKFSDKRKAFTLYFFGDRDPETYLFSKAPIEDTPPLKMRSEYDLKHTWKELYKVDNIIRAERGTCECGIERVHYHCGECGKLLKLKK